LDRRRRALHFGERKQQEAGPRRDRACACAEAGPGAGMEEGGRAATCSGRTAVWTEKCDLFTFGYGVDGQLGHGGKWNEPVPKLVEALIGKKGQGRNWVQDGSDPPKGNEYLPRLVEALPWHFRGAPSVHPQANPGPWGKSAPGRLLWYQVF